MTMLLSIRLDATKEEPLPGFPALIELVRPEKDKECLSRIAG